MKDTDLQPLWQPLSRLAEKIDALLSDEAPHDDELALSRLLTERDALLRALAEQPGMREPAQQPFWQAQLAQNRAWLEKAEALRAQAQELLILQRQRDRRLKAYRQPA